MTKLKGMDITIEGVMDKMTITGLKSCKLPANSKKFLGSFNRSTVWVFTNHRFIFIRVCDLNDNPPKTYKVDWDYNLEQTILDIV